MTEEQIKQNAIKAAAGFKDWYRPQMSFYDGYIAGAHSSDEEIAELKEEIESLKENEKELFEGFKKRGTKLGELMKENVKLRNPWISVEDRLPEKWKRIKVHSGTGEACWAWVSKTVFVIAEGWYDDPEKAFYDFDSKIWWSEYGDNIENLFGAPEYWMPIPQIKKGE